MTAPDLVERLRRSKPVTELRGLKLQAACGRMGVSFEAVWTLLTNEERAVIDYQRYLKEVND